MRKYNIDSIYGTKNNLDVIISQTGSKVMIREKGENKATPRIGYRITVSGETIAFGDWQTSERDLLIEAIKQERYAHLAYKELYYELIANLASIGLSLSNRDDNE